MEDLDKARAALKAMRERHKLEAAPLLTQINRLKQKAIRKGGRDTAARKQQRDDMLSGKARTDNPEMIAQGYQPIVRLADQPMYPMPQPGHYWCWNEKEQRHEEIPLDGQINALGEMEYRDGFGPDGPDDETRYPDLPAPSQPALVV